MREFKTAEKLWQEQATTFLQRQKKYTEHYRGISNALC